jgi:hypothetical protein
MSTTTKYQQPTPEIGMGATTGYGSDRYPYTVVAILSKRKIRLQADRYRRTDTNGVSEVQHYDITPDPDGVTVEATLRKDGSWVRDGDPLGHGQRFCLGHLDAHFDPHF